MVPVQRTVPCTVRTTRYVPLIAYCSDHHIIFFSFSLAFVAFFFSPLWRISSSPLWHQPLWHSSPLWRLTPLWRFFFSSAWSQDIHLATSAARVRRTSSPQHNESEPGTGGLIVRQDRAQHLVPCPEPVAVHVYSDWPEPRGRLSTIPASSTAGSRARELLYTLVVSNCSPARSTRRDTTVGTLSTPSASTNIDLHLVFQGYCSIFYRILLFILILARAPECSIVSFVVKYTELDFSDGHTCFQ